MWLNVALIVIDVNKMMELQKIRAEIWWVQDWALHRKVEAAL
jgi:hypothetical protein